MDTHLETIRALIAALLAGEIHPGSKLAAHVFEEEGRCEQILQALAWLADETGEEPPELSPGDIGGLFPLVEAHRGWRG